MTSDLVVEKILSDKRGSIINLGFKKRIFEVFELKKGGLRAGHYHDCKVTIVVLSGEIEYQEKDIPNNGPEKSLILKEGDLIVTESNHAHLLSGLKHSLVLEWREKELFKTENYPPMRSRVEENLISGYSSFYANVKNE
jgi:quercetin dioxygenase-like cupin family protein